MAGPVLRYHGEQREGRTVSWASRASVDSLPRRASTSAAAAATSPPVSRKYFSPGEENRYEESPLPMESPDAKQLDATRPDTTQPDATQPALEQQSRTAPAVMHAKHRPLSKISAGVPRHGELSYNEYAVSAAPSILRQSITESEDFELDPEAPIRAAKERSGESLPPVEEDEQVRRWDTVGSDRPLSPVRETSHSRSPRPMSGALEDPKGKAPETADEKKDEGPVWGESFQVEWIRTDRLPFYRTRHLRNPWNHDREVKVSRDGTELEPSVGQALLDEWDKPDTEPPPRPNTKSAPPAAPPKPV